MIHWLSEICSFIMDNILCWLIGFLLVFYFSLTAAGMLFGVNLGPKEKID